MMVEAEREVPGIMARHWAQPTLSACFQLMSSTACTSISCWRFSAQSITTPPITRALATVIGLNSQCSIRSAKARPRITAGKKAISRLMVKRCAWRSRGSPSTTSKMRWRNSHTTARIAPNWMMMLNALARSPPKPIRSATMIW
ncbi:hypothetical protein D3C78_1547670 [compost metagenome]